VYDLRYMPPARRYFKKVKDKGLADKFSEALNEIAKDPFGAGNEKTGDLAGIHCRDVYHNKTNYEIAYRIIEEEGRFVVVILAGTRENFYQELKRYMNI